MATQQDRRDFPCLRRHLTLLQQELYDAEKMLDINRVTNDSGNTLVRYQMEAERLARAVDEFAWILAYLDRSVHLPEKWPLHYWLFFAGVSGVSVGLTGLLLFRMFAWGG